MKRPFRFWMTGCFAVVMTAVGSGRAVAAGERNAAAPQRIDTVASRYNVGETLRRLQSCAARHGFTVFAIIEPHRAASGEADGCAVMVLESATGGTPVLMASPDAQPDLPLTVRVRATAVGLCEVWIARADWEDLPLEVARDLTELPAFVADALT